VPYAIIVAANDTTDSNPFQALTDFLDSPLWQFLIYMVYFSVAAIWLAGAYWVFKDARRRIEDPIVVGVCVAAALVFGPIGWIVYAIARPSELIADRRIRELDVKVMEQRLSGERCMYCHAPIRDDYLVCPSCGHRLRTQCRTCGRPVEPTWRMCPYCEEDARPTAAATDRR
jgi:hypothetical protein